MHYGMCTLNVFGFSLSSRKRQGLEDRLLWQQDKDESCWLHGLLVTVCACVTTSVGLGAGIGDVVGKGSWVWKRKKKSTKGKIFLNP